MQAHAATLIAASVLSTAAPAQQENPRQVDSMLTDAGPVEIIRVAKDLEHPWALQFMPDGRMLVTERVGRLRIIDAEGNIEANVGGLPKLFVEDQGGLLDVAIDESSFNDEPWVYLSYAKPGPEGKAATAVGRGRLVDDQLEGFTDLFVQEPWIEGGKHFGSRLIITPNRHMFITLGERFQFDPAQDLATHLGKVLRIPIDGAAPESGPFANRDDAKPEIWSYGHRNIQAAAVDPQTGVLWVAEMGPLGGDELNAVLPGRNYGWPEVSWGMNYDATTIPHPPTRPEFADAAMYWTPVISPSGMVFYTADKFPEWRDSMLVGGLSGHTLVRVRVRGDRVVDEERIPMPERIRDIQQGPDGLLYVLTDPKERRGELWKLRPLEAPATTTTTAN